MPADLQGRRLGVTDDAVVSAIAEFWRERGYGPTVLELADRFGYRSKASIHRRLVRLGEAGRVLMGDGPRTIRLP